jgi:hypothetical protein
MSWYTGFLFSSKVFLKSNLMGATISVDILRSILRENKIDVSWNVDMDEFFSVEACSHPSSFGCFQIDEHNQLVFLGNVCTKNLSENPKPYLQSLRVLGVCSYQKPNIGEITWLKESAYSDSFESYNVTCPEVGFSKRCNETFEYIRLLNERLASQRSYVCKEKRVIILEIEKDVTEKLSKIYQFSIQLIDLFGETHEKLVNQVIAHILVSKSNIYCIIHLEKSIAPNPSFLESGKELRRFRQKLNNDLLKIKESINNFFNVVYLPETDKNKRHFREKVWEELIQVVWSPKRIKYWWHEIELENLGEIEL